MGELVVATFNLHVGIDGWGFGFDAVGACAALAADVLVLEECFTPAGGKPLAGTIAEALGYEHLRVPLAPARRWTMAAGHARVDRRRWGPGRGTRTRSLIVDPAPGATRARRRRRGARRPGAETGTWDLAVLHRPPAISSKIVPLPLLRRDVAARQVALVRLDTGAGAFTVAATHLAHLSQGSPLQIRALGEILSEIDGPGALLGDMNCFGPPLVALLPGWRRAVKGRSWPTWRPIAQPDHVLVNRAVVAASGEVLRLGGSDHLPARARLSF